MQIRQNGAWVKAKPYIRQNNQWVLVDFLKDANEFLLIISTTTTNLNLQTIFNNTFGSTAWTSTKRKRVIINTGVIIGATSSNNNALTIPSGLGGSLKIENYGSIQGAGGSANSGTGGNAIFASSAASIDNRGTIYAGGGGGGIGGNGGQGSYNTTSTVVNTLGYSGQRSVSSPSALIGCNTTNALTGCSRACQQAYGSTINGNPVYAARPCGYGAIGSKICNTPCNYFCTTSGGIIYVIASESYTCSYNSTVISTVITSGGTGGSGGIGQGYSQSATNGLNGVAGGLNAGTGGNGGIGGAFGASGSNGTIGSNGNYTASPSLGQTGGPGYGGLAGFYIVNNGNITWTNLGTVAGRVV